MNTTDRFIGLAAALLCGVAARAAIVVPGADGSDGTLNITSNTVIDLSRAITTNWDANNSANAGAGVYDPEKWAVIFKYSNVTIVSGATVTFSNHPSRAPVVWLVGGDVTLNGEIRLDGQSHMNAPKLPEPGPGGFRGGQRDYFGGVALGPGFGPGGGFMNGGAASHGTVGGAGPATYGNPSLLPLIGGSGGSGGNSGGLYGYAVNGGAAGGGAILLACSNSVSINGNIFANGGNGNNSGLAPGTSGSGSGGGIRIVCATLNGAGTIGAVGGSGGNAGGLGRIRLERVYNNNNSVPVPAPSVVDLATNAVAMLWPPTNAPEVKVISIGTNALPADPRAAFGTYGADAAISLASNVAIRVATRNVETNAVVRVRITPRDTFNAYTQDAAYGGNSIDFPGWQEWTLNMGVNAGYSALQVQVIRP